MQEGYRFFVQQQAGELRALLPPNVPESFRAERYYPVLAKVVRHGEEEEEMEDLIATLPVQPQDGCVDLAHQQQRRQWIQKLNNKEIAQVSMLLEHNWQQQRASTPSWMRHLFPAKAPP